MMDPKPKRKRSPKAASKLSEKLALILAGIIPGLLACGLLMFFAGEDSGSSNTADQETAAPDQPVQETVIVPFDEVNPTLTRNEYRGQVRLFIEGTGQAAGTAYSDAFYLYTDHEGRPLEIPQTAMFDLEIDGQRAIVSLGLQDNPPPFAREDHLYPVIYDVGADARPIAFRISDNTVNDNTGEFRIVVVQLE